MMREGGVAGFMGLGHTVPQYERGNSGASVQEAVRVCGGREAVCDVIGPGGGADRHGAGSDGGGMPGADSGVAAAVGLFAGAFGGDAGGAAGDVAAVGGRGAPAVRGGEADDLVVAQVAL